MIMAANNVLHSTLILSFATYSWYNILYTIATNRPLASYDYICLKVFIMIELHCLHTGTSIYIKQTSPLYELYLLIAM